MQEAGFVAGKVLANSACLHPLVLGELLLGGLSAENEYLLRALPPVHDVPVEGVCEFIRKNSLAGGGIGWVDASILCAARAQGMDLSTFDRTLRVCAEGLGIPCVPQG
jgi:hypothetical protein